MAINNLCLTILVALRPHSSIGRRLTGYFVAPTIPSTLALLEAPSEDTLPKRARTQDMLPQPQCDTQQHTPKQESRL